MKRIGESTHGLGHRPRHGLRHGRRLLTPNGARSHLISLSAGLTPQAAQQILDGADDAAARWLLGDEGVNGGLPPEFLWPSSPTSPRSPLWMRDLSSPPDAPVPTAACDELSDALRLLGAKRLVVGHTVQSRINGACPAAADSGGSSSVYRIDVGLSAAMGGATPQALEIRRGGSVRVLASE